jgi:thioesterase domain-containing protein
VGLQKLRDDLGPDVELVALEVRGQHPGEPIPRSISEVAEHHARAVLSRRLGRPLVIGGHSRGGVIALELVRKLQELGCDPDMLVIVDSWSPGARPAPSAVTPHPLRSALRLRSEICRLAKLGRRVARDPRKIRSVFRYRQSIRFGKAMSRAAEAYSNTTPLDVRSVVITTEERRIISGRHDLGWGRILRGPVDLVELWGTHNISDEGMTLVVNEILRNVRP